MATQFEVCAECGNRTLFLSDDGPNGPPVWVCLSCKKLWENRDGKQAGTGEGLGKARIGVKWPE